MPFLDLLSVLAVLGLGGVAGLWTGLRAGGRKPRRQPAAQPVGDESQERLLTNLAHELRTPLTGLIGFADLAAQPNLDPARRIDGLNRAAAAGRRLLRVVNDLRDHARLRRGELRCHAIDTAPRQVIGRIEQFTRQAAERKGLLFAIHIDDAVPERAHFDPDRTAQVLMALLDNAIRFTRRGHVALTCAPDLLPDGRDALRLEVHDTGEGMPLRLCRALTSSRLRRPGRRDGTVSGTVSGTFRSAQAGPRQDDDGSDRRHGGVGLGLALATGIVEKLGGVMYARSTPGHGTTLRATLPIEPARTDGDAALVGLVPSARLERPATSRHPAGASRQRPDSRAAPLHARALVAIANSDARLLVGHALECVGLAVDETDSAGWREQIAGHDVVVLDATERDGRTRHEAREWLGAGLHRPRLLGLLPRTADNGDLHQTLLDEGFDAALPMPLDRDALATVLGELLRRSTTHQPPRTPAADLLLD